MSKRFKQAWRSATQLSLWAFSAKSPDKAKPTSQVVISIKDSDAALMMMWLDLHSEYFPQESYLRSYAIVWSKRRQKRVLASCSLRQRVVRVALEMKSAECAEWLEPLLYHEMCHAVLESHYKLHKRRIPWHGAEFRKLEARHPKIEGLNHWIKTGGWRKAVRRHSMKGN